MVKLPPQLLKALWESRCILFLGSGVSFNAGLPTATDLSHLLADELLKDLQNDSNLKEKTLDLEKNRDDLAKVSQFYTDYHQSRRAYQKVADALKISERNARVDILRPLRDLPTIREILTTNYDTLVESVLDPTDYNLIFDSTGLRQLSSARINLIKLHGTITDIKSMILTRGDYDKYSETHEALIDETKALLRKKVVIIVGYSMEDSNFASIYKKAIGNEDVENFFVTPDPSLNQSLHWTKQGFRHIAMTAEEFLNTLAQEYGSIHYTEPKASFPQQSKTPAVIDPLYNPFVLFDTEALMEQKPEFLFETFVTPVQFSTILEHQHTFIEGHRGSGKSTILWRLSLKALTFDKTLDLPMLGFYIKMVPGYFIAFRRKKNPNGDWAEQSDEWIRSFTHYFNLILLDGVLRNIDEAIKEGSLEANDQIGRVTQDIAQDLLRLQDPQRAKDILSLRRLVGKEIDTITNDRTSLPFYTGATFLTRALEYLSDSIIALQKKLWHMLLDEYDNVYPEQQAVINVILRERNSKLRFKIAVKTLHAHLIDVGGTPLDPTDDFGYVPCDTLTWDQNLKFEYMRFLEQISNQRLFRSGYTQLTIRDLLPEASKNFESSQESTARGRKKKRRRNNDLDTYYAGFETYSLLSSGLTRQFLELCKDAVYTAFPESAFGRVDLAPISAQIQNHVAKIHSAILFKSYRSTKEPQRVFRLFRVLGPVFRAIARITEDQEEYRNPLSFEVGDLDDLSEETLEILEESIKSRLLQFPVIPKKPHNPLKEGPAQKYSFHRLLGPIFGLSVRERYDVPIKASTLNIIWLDPDRAIKEITEGYKNKGIQKYLDINLPLFPPGEDSA